MASGYTPFVDIITLLVAHAQAGAALDLRVARLVAWFKRQDLRALGYTSYRAFGMEHVDWCDSWLRACVRLVESGLTRVQAAVCGGFLPLRDAVRAPGQTTREDEELWLASALTERPRRRRHVPAPEVDLSGAELRTIHAARDLARIHLGAPVDDAQADRHILAAWHRRDGAATLREASEPPPPPAPLSPWCDVPDPATVLVGVWQEPASIAEGLAALRFVLGHRRTRVLEMGALYRRVVRERAWTGRYDSMADLLTTHRIEKRTLQRAAALVDALEHLPDTTVAVVSGEITLDEARRIASVASEEDEAEWVQTILWYTPPDVARLVELASRGVPILPVASGVIDMLIEGLEVQDRVTFTGIERQVPAPRHAAVHRDLAAAAAWYLEHTRLEPQRGFGRVKERDRHRCRNPECRRPTARAQAHHVVFRSHGGSDAHENGVTQCTPCHLRGVHGGAFSVERVSGALVWSYPGRRVVEVGVP
jgi:hypothetical protein